MGNTRNYSSREIPPMRQAATLASFPNLSENFRASVAHPIGGGIQQKGQGEFPLQQPFGLPSVPTPSKKNRLPARPTSHFWSDLV